MPSEDIMGLSVWSLEMKAVACPLFALGWCSSCCPPCPHKTLVSCMRVSWPCPRGGLPSSLSLLSQDLSDCSAPVFCSGALYQPAYFCPAYLLGSVSWSTWFGVCPGYCPSDCSFIHLCLDQPPEILYPIGGSVLSALASLGRNICSACKHVSCIIL